MVRGNWQKRVERTQLRRDLAKNKKIRKSHKALYKSLVQNKLFPLLERFESIDPESQLEKLHLWVDCEPHSRLEEDSKYDDDDDLQNKKTKKKGKKQSYKGHGSQVEKKAHPRSHENTLDEEVPVSDEQLLCRDHFFTGSCGGRIKGSKSKKNIPDCQYYHYSSKKDLTLFRALNSKSSKDTDICLSAASADIEDINSTLSRAAHAADLAQRKLDGLDTSTEISLKNTGIDVLHYMQIHLFTNSGGEINAVDAILEVFSKEMVNIGAIAYVAYGNTLIFDRFDGGLVISPEAELAIFGGKDKIESEMSANISDGIIHFPETVLEQIICYLPASYAGILPKVCKAFQEVGTTSPSLWKSLIERNGWPLPENQDSDPITLHKVSFISHYRICQRVESMNEGLVNLMENDHGSHSQNTAIISFSDKHNCPSGPTILSLWDETSVLVASKNDCVFYMYKPFGVSGNGKSLREVFSIRIAPVPISKKTECALESVALDDCNIACSFVVNDNNFIASITKDDLLSNSTEDAIEGDDILKVRDLTMSFFDHCQQNDYGGDIDYENLDNLNVKIVGNLEPCGNGIFCGTMRVCDESDNENGVEEVKFGILSMSLSNRSNEILDFVELSPLGMANPMLSTNYHLKKRTDATEITYKHSLGSYSFSTTLDREGKFREKRTLEVTPTLELGPETHSSVHTVRMPTSIATSFILRANENSSKCVGCTFESIEQNDCGLTHFFLEREYASILSAKCMDKDHLLLACACQKRDDSPTIDGHWFGDDFDRNSELNDVMDLIIIHVPSMKEIHSVKLKSSSLHTGEVKYPTYFEIRNNSAIVCMIENIGISLSGASMMDSFTVTEDSCIGSMQKSARKAKKKKRLAAVTAGKSGKKDGFARGQGLRGG